MMEQRSRVDALGNTIVKEYVGVLPHTAISVQGFDFVNDFFRFCDGCFPLVFRGGAIFAFHYCALFATFSFKKKCHPRLQAFDCRRLRLWYLGAPQNVSF
jgi:hypothetical protein